MADLLIGLMLVATRYGGPAYDGRTMYWGDTYDYARTHIAVPLIRVTDGTYHHNDLLVIRGLREDGSTWWMQARVLDVGPFSQYCVIQRDGACLPIAFDIGGQAPWGDELSAQVLDVYNVTAEVRRGD